MFCLIAFIYWRKVRNDAYDELDDRLAELKKSYHRALQDLTESERARLMQYGQQILAPVFSHLEVVAETCRTQQKEVKALEAESTALREEIESIQIITG